MDDDEFLRRLQDILAVQKTEADYLKLCSLYRKAAPGQRDVLRDAWRPNPPWKVPSSSDFPLARPSMPHEVRIAAVLIFHSIENLRMDSRDTLVGLSAVHHAALKTGVDVKRAFADIGGISTPKFTDFLGAWFTRSTEDQSLGAFGWRDQSTREQIRFVG